MLNLYHSLYNNFLKLNEDFSHLYVSLIIFYVILCKQMPICCFSLAYADFEHGFVYIHAQVDVRRAYCILIHIMHAHMLIKNLIYVHA